MALMACFGMIFSYADVHCLESAAISPANSDAGYILPSAL